MAGRQAKNVQEVLVASGKAGAGVGVTNDYLEGVRAFNDKWGAQPGEAKLLSSTAQEFLEITAQLAVSALNKLINAHIPDRNAKNFQSTEKGWAAAKSNPQGCVLLQKSPSVS